MQSADLWQANRAIWTQVTTSVRRAVVYMDTKMAELLHWSGGLGVLISAGAVDAREFSSFESADESQKKCVFLVSSPLDGMTEDVIRDIVTQSHFQYVVVMTTVSPLLHKDSLVAQEDDREFGEFEDQVLEWMGNMNYTVEVKHIPLFSAEIFPGVFLAPAFSGLFPLLASDLRQISYQHNASHSARESKHLDSLEDLECHHLPSSMQDQIKSLASGLHALLQVLDVREDVYSMGPTARLVASELGSYPPARSRRKNCQNRASLVVVDRTLDTTAAVTHQTDTLLDRMMNTLDRLPGHCTDRSVDMRPLCHIVQNETSESSILPGSLASSKISQAPSHLAPLIGRRQKEAVMDVNRKLVEAASAEKLPLDLSARPGRVSADQLASTVALFKGKYDKIRKHLDLLQVAMATAQALKHPSNALWDVMVAKEKSLVQSLGEEEEEVAPSGLAVMSKVILEERAKVKEDRSLGLDQVLCLLTYLYSVSDGDCGEEEEAATLREQLGDWVLAEREDLPPLTKQIVGDQVTETILADQIENVWERLSAVGEARSGLMHFGSVLDPGDAMTPAQVKGVLRQVMERVVDPAKPELPDLVCRTGGLKDLLKSGFGFFKGSGKPRPGDAPLFILYVIGGISANEIKQIREVVEKAKPGFEVLIGSSHLCSIEQGLQSLLVNDNINLDRV